MSKVKKCPMSITVGIQGDEDIWLWPKVNISRAKAKCDIGHGTTPDKNWAVVAHLENLSLLLLFSHSWSRKILI